MIQAARVAKIRAAPAAGSFDQPECLSDGLDLKRRSGQLQLTIGHHWPFRSGWA